MTSLSTRAPIDRWSDISPLRRGPRASISTAVARRIFDRVVDRLDLTVSTDGSDADIVLHRPDEFFARIGNDGLIGFGEAYLTGAWDAPDLAGTLTVLCAHIDSLTPAWMQRLRAAYVARRPSAEQNTRANSRGNIAHHYDLSNELFATFLDPTMSYSSALFADDAHPGGDLEDAQARKVEAILDAARVTSGSRVLEIGTGWGELAIRAARRGATVRSITLSTEQQELARRRIAEAGLSDRVDVDLLDYRAVDGEFDAVVSVEMIEAVGHEYLPAYFETIDRVLAPGGAAAIQAITMPHRRMLATRNTWTWIQKYIFPGGFLPSTELLDDVTRRRTGLRLTGRRQFGAHYAETLRQWDAAFLARRERVLDLGFDETFVRMWHFYLAYARAGFASGYLDVQQLTFTREAR
jgi:cyclopropane-fatty-acyl-phospholipid synthase